MSRTTLRQVHRNPVTWVITLLLAVILIAPACGKGEKEEPMAKTTGDAMPTPPKAEKIKKELTLHGHTRIDNYYWLNQRENPKVIEYLNGENDYLKAILKHTEPLQEKLYNEIVGRMKKDDSSAPYKHNGYFYYTRYIKGGEYPIHCRKKGSLEAEEEIMLDVNQMAEGHDFYRVTGLRISPDNTILAFGVDTVSRRKYTLQFKNLVTGEMLPDKMVNTTGTAAWANDNKTVFYTGKEEGTLRSYKIFKHKLGDDPANDKEIFHEADNTFGTTVFTSKSQKYIFIVCYHTLSNEFRYVSADNPDEEFKIFQARERDLEFSVDHFEDKFYIRTNLDAKNFKLMSTPIDKTAKENWTDVIGHRDDVLLEGFEIFNNYLVVKERKNALTHLRVIKWEDKSEHYLDFGEEAYVAYISTNKDFDTDTLRYGYTSMTTPRSTYDYDMVNKKKTLVKQQEVLGGFDPANYKTERLFATAADGTKIPVSLVYRKGLTKNGDNPLLLNGYGSYGYSANPSFRSSVLSLLDRGFVFALAHIRGGQDMGRYWYEDGKLLKKKNTFTDFIDCGKFLVEQKFTNPGKLFAIGGSAGGLLMGAVINMAPELWKGIVAGVPFVDVVTTMLDESIPLTTGEFDEWGNPKDKKYYDYMLSYSPYDQVEAKDYPAMLVTAGLHDSQVQYFEPAKWVAKLRELKTDKNILLMHTNMEAGHGGASGRFRAHKETALTYAFMLDLLGITE